MNETGTAARAWMNPTETEQRAETQILRPSFRLISGLENTASPSGLKARQTRHRAVRTLA
jgi:hypothetical protein